MNTEQKPVVYEYEEINREIIILFKDTPIIEDESILKDKDREKVAHLIPNLIKNGKIKISLKDVTDINKDRLKDIIQIGRDLLIKKMVLKRN